MVAVPSVVEPSLKVSVPVPVEGVTVAVRLTCARNGGRQALLSRVRGTHAKLTEEQKRLIPDFLWHGPEAYGFRGEVWTCPRVVDVLAQEFGATYHRDHVSRILKELGWTPQIPITRAIQRDEAVIAHWRTRGGGGVG